MNRMWYSVRWQLAIQFLLVAGLGAASGPDHLTRGNLLFEHGSYPEAIAEYDDALPLAGSATNRAEVLYRLALAHGKLAGFPAAERYYKQALDILRADGDSFRLALTLGGLGEVYRAEHRLDDALTAERHALGILQRLGMGEAQQAAAILTITGGILHDQHRSNAAQQDLREALSILDKTVGPHHPDFALTLHNLGAVEASRKNYGEAEGLFTRALRIREERFGPAHPLIAGTLLSLSTVYLQQKRYAEADRSCRRSLDMMRRFLPANHPDLIEAHINLAIIAHRSGDAAAAIDVLEQAVHSLNARPSTVTREYIQLLNLYSRYLGDAGEKEKSRRFRLEARRLAEQSGGTSPASSTVTVAELEAGGIH